MKIWEDKRYYDRIERLDDLSHPGFLLAQEYCQEAKKILDVGCGNGSKLKKLGNSKTKRFGCEVSSLAKQWGFQVFNGIKLPYKDCSFDRVVSFFVLEHTDKPKELLVDMVRVLETGGLLILLAPNFGAPNRASPNFEGSRIMKLIFNPEWHNVKPKIDSMEDFESDLDTTFESYLGTIAGYLPKLGMKIIEKNSFWEMERSDAKIIQKLFRHFFADWGPHLFLVVQKIK